MTHNELANWWRIRRGLPALRPSDREIRRMLARYDRAEGRRVQARLDQLVTDAETFGLPLPFVPTEVVAGFVVHGQARS